MTNLVSIIVPVHNSEKYLHNCIDSLLNQTYKNIEIIAVENGSIDSSKEILKSYKNKIKTITLRKASIGKARNAGLDEAQGEYISFIDSDDTVEPTFIEDMLNKMIKDNSDLVICDHYEIHEQNGKKEKIKNYPFKETSYDEILKNLHKINYANCNKLYKKELIDIYKLKYETNIKYEDLPFVYNYITKATKISKVNKHLYNYYIHKESEQTTVDERIFDIIKAVNLIRNSLDNKNIENLYVLTLTRYSLKTRYIKNSSIRRKFINEAYKELDKNFKDWKNSEYIKELPKCKRIIETNKFLVKLYTQIYSILI